MLAAAGWHDAMELDLRILYNLQHRGFTAQPRRDLLEALR
jgi:hypothetical protein